MTATTAAIVLTYLLTVTGSGEEHTSPQPDATVCADAASFALYGKTVAEDAAEKAAFEARNTADEKAWNAKHPFRTAETEEERWVVTEFKAGKLLGISGYDIEESGLIRKSYTTPGQSGIVYSEDEAAEYHNGRWIVRGKFDVTRAKCITTPNPESR